MLALAPLLLALSPQSPEAPAVQAPAVRERVTQSRPAPALSISFAGIESLFVDPRDRGLRDFLLDTVDRLPEYAASGGWDQEMPIDPVQAGLRLFTSSWELRLEHRPNAMPLPMSGRLQFFSESAEELREDEKLLLEFLGSMGLAFGEREQDRDGLRPFLVELDEGVPDVRIGTRSEAGGETLIVAFNEGEAAPLPRLRAELPSDVQPAFSMRADASDLMAMFDFSCSSPMVPPVLRGMCDLAAELEAEVSVGHGKAESHSTFRFKNMLPLLRDLQLLDEQPLSVGDLALVPFNSTDALIGRMNPDGVLVLMERITQAMGDEDVLAELSEEAGLDVGELIASLGNTIGFYKRVEPPKEDLDFFELATVGMRSFVIFVEVENEDPVREALARLEREMAEEGVAGSEAEAPFELDPQWRFEAGFLFFSFSSELADRAAAQARDRSNSLLERPAMREAIAGAGDELTLLGWSDVPRLAHFGYDRMLEASAMAAEFLDMFAIEMRVEDIFPSEEALLANARPTVTTVVREGQDLVGYSTSDRSMLLGLCAAGGEAGWLDMLMMLGTGAAFDESMEIEAKIEQAPEEVFEDPPAEDEQED